MPTPPNTPLHPSTHSLLHGITLERMITELVNHFGWDGLYDRINVRCFYLDPSITSSLKFLRKTPWARAEVEALYVYMRREQEEESRKNAVNA
jgi:uncharacterized protein (DUF2132 family)